MAGTGSWRVPTGRVRRIINGMGTNVNGINRQVHCPLLEIRRVKGGDYQMQVLRYCGLYPVLAVVPGQCPGSARLWCKQGVIGTGTCRYWCIARCCVYLATRYKIQPPPAKKKCARPRKGRQIPFCPIASAHWAIFLLTFFFSPLMPSRNVSGQNRGRGGGGGLLVEVPLGKPQQNRFSLPAVKLLSEVLTW